MQTSPPTTRLLPLQTRVIHASAGWRLQVISGRLWLTQPNVAQDLFLGPGTELELRQDWVVVGADAQPRPSAGSPQLVSEYRLLPLLKPATRSRWLAGIGSALGRVARRLGTAAVPALGRGQAR